MELMTRPDGEVSEEVMEQVKGGFFSEGVE